MANKKVAIIGVSSILLVAMVVAAAVTVTRKNNNEADSQVTTSTKAVQAICQPTDYKQTCEDSLSSAAGNASDPKDLIKVAFNVTIKHISDAIKKSAPLQQAANDPRAASALKTCQELLDDSVDDLRKSFDRMAGSFDLSKVDEYIFDLKVWLSGAITYQETCLDGFENTTGDAGQKMREILKMSAELTRNALAMIDEFSKVLPKFSSPSSRRLLASDGTPTWVDGGKRRLLQVANYNNLKPNVVVSKGGPVKTINDALKAIPPKNTQLFVISVEPGVYAEYVHIAKGMANVALIGSDPLKTKITGNKNNVDGVETFKSATVVVDGVDFFARGIGFENSAGPAKHQAVALRASGDRAIFVNCRFDGYQDTLYAHNHRQLYRDCVITGTIDFIFGDALAVFQNCKMLIRRPSDNQACMVTAQGRTYKRQDSGFVIQKSFIGPDHDFKLSPVPIKAYLGRPWKELSRTVIMQTDIDGAIAPEGWAPWNGLVNLDTCYYAEYANTGPGSDLSRRVNWRGYKKINGQEATQFTADVFIKAATWVKQTGVQYIPGL